MKKQKFGRPPKGKKSMTGAERQARYKQRIDIITDELKQIGVKPMTTFIPPIYLEALRAYEDGFNARPNLVDAVVKGSGWLCLAIEQFILKQAEILPDSELAKIVDSPEWVNCKSLDFETAAMNAKLRIYEFEKEFINENNEQQ